MLKEKVLISASRFFLFFEFRKEILKMTYPNITTMNYQQLQKEIEKNKTKIKKLQDTIRLLEKLQIAEQVKQQNIKPQNNNNRDDQQWR